MLGLLDLSRLLESPACRSSDELRLLLCV